MLNDVYAIQQQQPYTCSAATLRAVMQHWGSDATEAELAQLIGARPDIGANVSQLAAAARQLGFKASVFTGRSINDLTRYVGAGRPLVPVILAVKSFNRPGTGHFVVVVALDSRSVTIMDPNSPTNWRVLGYPEFLDRWLGWGGSATVITPRSAI